MWERNVIRTIYGLLLMAYIIRVTHDAGGSLNKKDGLNRYGDSHVKDKTF